MLRRNQNLPLFIILHVFGVSSAFPHFFDDFQLLSEILTLFRIRHADQGDMAFEFGIIEFIQRNFSCDDLVDKGSELQAFSSRDRGLSGMVYDKPRDGLPLMAFQNIDLPFVDPESVVFDNPPDHRDQAVAEVRVAGKSEVVSISCVFHFMSSCEFCQKEVQPAADQIRDCGTGRRSLRKTVFQQTEIQKRFQAAPVFRCDQPGIVPLLQNH